MDGPIITNLYSGKRLPSFPLCADRLEEGVYRRSQELALKKRYIQANPNKAKYRLIYDVDHRLGRYRWQDANLATPNWVANNPENGHCHIAYELAISVAVDNFAAKDHPIRYAAAIQHAYTRELKADRGYAHLICKNPLSPSWDTQWLRKEPYDLGELAEWVDLPKRMPKKEATGLGRNCTLFDNLRKWAYKGIREFWDKGYERWKAACKAVAESFNIFRAPLNVNEVKGIAWSVAKWTWANITPKGFKQHQTNVQCARWRDKYAIFEAGEGCRFGLSLDALRYQQAISYAKQRFSQGIKVKTIADELGIAPMSVYRYLRK